MFGAFLTYVSTNAVPLLVVFTIVGAIWLIVLTTLTVKTRKSYKVLIGNETSQSIKALLEKHTKQVGEIHNEVESFRSELNKVEEDILNGVSKSFVYRFNPFGDTGGDQSFVVVLLDRHDNGMVLTSMHGRDRTRVYAKSIKEGQAEGYELSEEEQLAIQKAKGE